MPNPPRVESQWKAERERLASELRRLEEALSDARDGAGGEEEGSLVARLRDATRKRARIEEEFERSSDRWREERRNLNAEIDRLDRALQKAQADVRRSRSSESVAGAEFQSELRDTLRAHEELKGAFDDDRNRWDSERQALEAKVADLESGLVDALERANNAARSGETRDLTLRAEVEAQRSLVESRIRTEFESALEEARRTAAALEEERGRLHLEIHRLKESAEKTADRADAQTQSKPSLKDRLRGRLRASDEKNDSQEELESLLGQVAAIRTELEAQTLAAEEARAGAEAADARVRELEARLRDPGGASRPDADAAPAWLEERDGLIARIGELEAALGGAAPDTAAQEKLELRLAESARALADLQSEFDSSSGAWSGEREDLTGRIGALETALAKAESLNESGVRAAGEFEERTRAAEERARSAGERAEALETRLGAESGRGETEREALTAKVDELGFALEQARSDQTDVQNQYAQLRAEFEEARQQGNDLQKEMEARAGEWDQERASLSEQVESLQLQLREARQADASADATTQKLLADLEASEAKLAEVSSDWTVERKGFDARIRDLEQQIEAGVRAAEADRRKLEADIENAREAQQSGGEELAEASQQLEAARSEWDAERERLEQELASLRHDAEARSQTTETERQGFEMALAAAHQGEADLRQQLETEASRHRSLEESLSDRIAELEASLNDSATGGEAGFAEALEARQALEGKLRRHSEDREAERGELLSTIAALEEEVNLLRRIQAKGKSGLDEVEESAASRGIASFGRVLSSLGGGANRENGKSVAELEARRQALETRLQESEDSRQELAAKLESATEEWQDERLKFESQLETMNQTIRSGSENDQAALDAQHVGLRARLQEAEARYTALETASMASAKAWDEQRIDLEKEIAQWEQQVVAEAERVAEETRKALAEEYDKQLRELRSQKEALESQLQSAGGAPSDVRADPAFVAAEMARVDSEIGEINRLIEDPNAALPNVMRKNAERSELKAYRRGLSYLAERFARGSGESSESEDEVSESGVERE
jgi:chromosome segregation ATPase